MDIQSSGLVLQFRMDNVADKRSYCWRGEFEDPLGHLDKKKLAGNRKEEFKDYNELVGVEGEVNSPTKYISLLIYQNHELETPCIWLLAKVNCGGKLGKWFSLDDERQLTRNLRKILPHAGMHQWITLPVNAEAYLSLGNQNTKKK